jgi:hypothetical protein
LKAEEILKVKERITEVELYIIYSSIRNRFSSSDRRNFPRIFSEKKWKERKNFLPFLFPFFSQLKSIGGGWGLSEETELGI